MRTLLLFIVISMTCGKLVAQVDTVQKEPYISKIDSAFSPLLADSIPYNILYDRVFPWAGLRFTSSGDTIDFSLMKQAWYELELSRLSEATTGLGQSLISYNTLRDTAYSSRIKNRVQISAIAVKMSTLDTLAFTDGRLDSTAAGWDRAVGMASPFETKDVTMSALSMDEFIAGKEYEIQLKSDFVQNTDRVSIESVEIFEPGNGIDITLLPDQSTTFTLSDTGHFYITLKINFSDDSFYLNLQQIKVESPAPPRSTCDRERMIIESDIPFKGPDETVGTTSLADVYFYYHYDENGDCQKRLEKPILICDGFDPQDDRKIKDIEELLYFRNSSGLNVKTIEKFRELGFDVIVMNFPVIGSDAVDGRVNVKDENGNLVNKDMRDGGTDYTQRNAMLMVKLIQMVNEQLETNGSDEELGIIGPSMGGQVTRYALAYMEEKHAQGVPDMDHNTRVWISFDSPHHGANIPLGNTGLLASLGYSLNQTTAKEEFENRVNTNAAQQYLINQAVPGIIQSPFFNYIELYQNNTAPRRIQYINNLTSNGLPGSSGWPQNVKRVSVVNSSDKGAMNGTPGEEAIFIKGTAFFGLITVARLQSFLQVDYNNWNRPLFSAGINKIISGGTYSADVKNGNPPGSIDILPGSKSNSTEAVFNGLVENIEKRANVEKKRLKPNHTFMPVISALAFNNTNIDWGQRLDDRNLVCTGEIPFDDYLISGTNQSHITITEDIYKYIEYQLINGEVGCSQICGSYSISGDTQICNTNTTHTYTFNGTIANDQSLTWEVTGDLEIDNTTGQTIDVKATVANGSGKIIAILENDCGNKIEKVFQVTIGFFCDFTIHGQVGSQACLGERNRIFINLNDECDNYNSISWDFSGAIIGNAAGTAGWFMGMSEGYGDICATLTNDCGSKQVCRSVLITRCGGPIFSTVGESSNDIKVKLAPNPMSGISYLFVDKDPKTVVDIRIFDHGGRLLQQFKSSNNKVPIQLAKEASGVYIVECKVGNNVIHKKLIKS